jgi:D-beta-D-heptose 7-phosphate kinase/D-beta-D-heptose 1-phosphate adenosyltransferase
MKRVWVNGAFDILHPGHLDLLQFAAIHGKLRVGIDSDERVKTMKGEDRPYFALSHRVRMIKSLRFVDEVVTFSSEEELITSISAYSPHFIVVGDEYRGSVIGEEHCKEVLFFPRTPGFSTTNILHRC